MVAACANATALAKTLPKHRAVVSTDQRLLPAGTLDTAFLFWRLNFDSVCAPVDINA